jgi:hypothetical protein
MGDHGLLIGQKGRMSSRTNRNRKEQDYQAALKKGVTVQCHVTVCNARRKSGLT